MDQTDPNTPLSICYDILYLKTKFEQRLSENQGILVSQLYWGTIIKTKLTLIWQAK